MGVSNSYVNRDGTLIMIHKIESVSGLSHHGDRVYFDIITVSGHVHRVFSNNQNDATIERDRLSKLLSGIGWS